MDNIFETEVVKAELTYFLLDDASRETDDYTYYWNIPSASYPIIVPILEYPEYSYYLIKGLCVSVGGISESVIKYSSN
jgi:tubulin-specific chaperone D